MDKELYERLWGAPEANEEEDDVQGLLGEGLGWSPAEMEAEEGQSGSGEDQGLEPQYDISSSSEGAAESRPEETAPQPPTAAWPYVGRSSRSEGPSMPQQAVWPPPAASEKPRVLRPPKGASSPRRQFDSGRQIPASSYGRPARAEFLRAAVTLLAEDVKSRHDLSQAIEGLTRTLKQIQEARAASESPDGPLA